MKKKNRTAEKTLLKSKQHERQERYKNEETKNGRKKIELAGIDKKSCLFLLFIVPSIMRM